jgi:general stress protein 26
MNPPSPPSDKVQDLLQSFHTAMLVTHTTTGSLHARPMEIAQTGSGSHVWFFTSLTSPKTEEIRQDQEVLLTLQKDHQKYLSIIGTADLVTDQATLSAYWKESYRVWFPEGLNDPHLALVHIIPQQAEYWDNSATQGVRYLYEAVGAPLSGTTPDLKDTGNHGVVPLT